MSSSSVPGVDAMQDSLEFIKKMWGGLGMPGMVVPTLSVEEINKKIADLKAVESWLSLNLNMLRTTIQALEVQSATISALQAMGTADQSRARQEGGGAESNASAWATPTGFPFSSMNPPQNADVSPASGQARDETSKQAMPPVTENSSAASGAAYGSLGNSGAWWDLLQNQFKQAVNSVVAAEKVVVPAVKAAVDGGAKSVVKPRSKKSSGAASKSVGGKTAAVGGKTVLRSGKAKAVPK